MNLESSGMLAEPLGCLMASGSAYLPHPFPWRETVDTRITQAMSLGRAGHPWTGSVWTLPVDVWFMSCLLHAMGDQTASGRRPLPQAGSQPAAVCGRPGCRPHTTFILCFPSSIKLLPGHAGTTSCASSPAILLPHLGGAGSSSLQ